LDTQRLLDWLQPQLIQQQHQQTLQQQALQDGKRLVVYALFETLGANSAFLEDAALCAASVRQLAANGWKVSTEDGQRFPGFYKLLAHPDPTVRSQVRNWPSGAGR
jgi:hypothetical protein